MPRASRWKSFGPICSSQPPPARPRQKAQQHDRPSSFRGGMGYFYDCQGCGSGPEGGGMSAPDANGWLPIETAPKDGTPIIGAFFDIRWADSHRKHDIERVWWQPEFEAFISSCREMVLAPGYTFENGATRELHSPVIEPVTHWIPLPKPPVGA